MTEPHSNPWADVSPYLDEALELDPHERESWLATLAATAPLLAGELRELLALHAANRASGFMERSSLRGEESLAGEQIGPYTIERLLGRGGMGSVWLARRSDGQFEGSVAIKLLDRRGLGRDAAEQIRHEASLLARLSHPHIARLFDAGVRENGQPYLILEYIAGERIDRYCATHQLPLAARLRLFLGVLDAVAHAQSQLVVHRDLKPSNVLVTSEGVVKLLDFGVAALQPLRQTPPITPTEAAQALTPGYAAPEQLRGEPVSAATDVYALGILLYVLITGKHPYGSQDSTHTALLRAALTDELRPASARLTAAVERRKVRGDLDAVIARALSRDPAARYATAAEFASDVRAYLGNFPVRARAATRAYVARKFAQRHWGGVVTALLTLLVLSGATVVTTLQTLEARQQRDFARTQLARAEAINDLNDYVLNDAAPAGRPFTAKELLTRAAHVLERQRTTDVNRVALLTSIGGEYDSQDQDSDAVRLLNEAYRLSRGISDPSARSRAACALARALSKGQASPRVSELLNSGLRELPDDADFALDRAFCSLSGSEVALNAGDPLLAIRRVQGAIDALDRVPFDHEMAQLHAEESLAEAYRAAGRFREANTAFERAWPRLVALGRDDTRTAVEWLNNWALDLYQLGRPLEAERLLRRSIDIDLAEPSGEGVSPMLLTNYAQMLFELGRPDEAASYAERAYQSGLQADDSTVINQTMLRLARIYRAQHDYTRATAMLNEVEPRLRKALPPGHSAFGALASERSLNAQQQGDTVLALTLANQAIEIVDEAAKEHGEGAQFLPMLLIHRASIETDAGRLQPAENDARRALVLLQAGAQPGDFSMSTGRAYLTLARVLSAEGKPSEARREAQRAAQQLEQAVGADHPDTRAAEGLSRMPIPRSP